MFKVDFFEFYAVLERYITTCLTIRGIYISSNAPKTNVNALRFQINPDFARSRPEASHQFHANLLEALGRADSPFGLSFGRQDVLLQLGIAKDYRNRWKDADALQQPERRVIREELDLEVMLPIILTGCAQALEVIHATDAQVNSAANRNGNYESLADGMTVDEDIPLEFMDDAMDLD